MNHTTQPQRYRSRGARDTSQRTHEPGTRQGEIANALVRAREENRPIYVLQFQDKERTYTSSTQQSLRSGPTRCHGHAEKMGRRVIWVPLIITDVDDAIAYLEAMDEEELAAAVRMRKGDA